MGARTRSGSTCSPGGWPRRWRSRSWSGWSVRTAGRRCGRRRGSVAGFAAAGDAPRLRARPPRRRSTRSSASSGPSPCSPPSARCEHRRPVARDGGRGARLGAGAADQDPRLVPDPDRRWPGPVVRLGVRAGLAALAAWAATGLGLFVLGWPWLWYDPLARLQAYLGDRRRPRWRSASCTSARSSPIATCPGITPGSTSRRRSRSACTLLGLLGLVRGWQRPPCRPVPAPPGRRDRAVPRPVQHQGAGLRRRTAVPARLPALGPPDRPGLRDGLGAGRPVGGWLRAGLVAFVLAQGYRRGRDSTRSA